MGTELRGAEAVICDVLVDRDVVVSQLPEEWRGRVRAQSELPRGPGVAVILVGPGLQVTEATLDGLPTLRSVVVTSMGWDHVDLRAAAARGVSVGGIGPYCAQEVAEHTLALILDLLRGVTRLDRSVRRGAWDYASLARSVRGTVLGLVGMGRIGTEVAWRARALRMAVVAYDPVLSRGGADGASGAGGPGHEVEVADSLSALVAQSDVVSLHLPLTDATRSIVDRSLLARFKPGAYLVNVARGELVDEAALRDALGSGRLAGAALDVLVHEPPEPSDPLLVPDTVVVTPHAAWYSPEAIETLSLRAGEALRGALEALEALETLAEAGTRGKEGP